MAVPEMTATPSDEKPESPFLKVIEPRLQAIWKEILRAEEVNSMDDFFSLGGDSLAAIRLLVAIEAEFGEGVLEPDAIYSDSRFCAMAELLAGALAHSNSPALSA